MKPQYILTEKECAEKGLPLNDYALDGTYIPALINRALDISITRCCYNYDEINGEEDLELALDKNPQKVSAFKKLQFNILWNLIFTATDDPVDVYIDTIIAHELNLGKINGIQKGLYYKHN